MAAKDIMTALYEYTAKLSDPGFPNSGPASEEWQFLMDRWDIECPALEQPRVEHRSDRPGQYILTNISTVKEGRR